MMQLNDLKTALQITTEMYSKLPVHVAAFCAFMIKDDRANLVSLVRDIDYPEGDHASYQMISCVGYALASDSASDRLLKYFNENIAHLSGRIFFSMGRVPKFEIDGVALLGIALGISSIGEVQGTFKWFADLLDKSSSAISKKDWEYNLIKGAQMVLGEASPNDISDVTLRVALQASLGRDIEQVSQQQAWEKIPNGIGVGNPTKLAVSRSVFDHCAAALSRLPIHGAGVSELVFILENLSYSMSHWTYEKNPRVKSVTPQQWEIDHEYHVQNLLWTVLRPVFADLVDEQPLIKLGHKTPRFDLAIPSLQTIVEVKYMRRSGRAECRKITEEIAADRSLYLGSQTGYTKLLVFIWDNCCQTEEYETLKGGLESLEGIEKVIILPRPSKMARITI